MIAHKQTQCSQCGNILSGKQRKFCSLPCKKRFHYRANRNPYNNKIYAAMRIRAAERKQKLIGILGGACQKCGYKKSLRALCFHHKDPKDKKLRLDSRTIGNRKWETVLIEAKKCELLCANCHMELHEQEVYENNY